MAMGWIRKRIRRLFGSRNRPHETAPEAPVIYEQPPMTAPVVGQPPSAPVPTVDQLPSSSFRDSLHTPQPTHSRSRAPSFVLPIPENETYALSSLSAQCALTLSEATKEIAPVPTIGKLIGPLKEVYQAVERSKVNKDQWKLLQGRCVMVLRIAGAHVAKYGKDRFPNLDEAVTLLQDTLNRIEERARYYNEMNELIAMLHFQSISDEIQRFFVDLDACLALFNFSAETAQEQWMGEYQAVQRRESSELQRLRGELEKMNINLDVFGKNQEELLVKTNKIADALQQVLNDKSHNNEAPALSLLAAQCALALPEVTKEIALIPTVGQLVGPLQEVYQAVERCKVNKNQWGLLRGRCVLVLRIAGAHVEVYGRDDLPNLSKVLTLLQKSFNRIVERATHFNEMGELVALAFFQLISDEIRMLFADLDACLNLFNSATEFVQEQWAEYQAVQRREIDSLQKLRGELEKMNISFDVLTSNHDLSQGKAPEMITLMATALQQVLDDKSVILQDRTAVTTASHNDAQELIRTILSVTKLRLPSKLLLDKLCVVEMPPIKSDITCDIYRASFLGGMKVAKKVFRLGTSDKDNVERYAKQLLENTNIWSEIQSGSNYILPFYGIGMEPLEEDNYFQLYMVLPFINNFDAVTFMKEYRGNKGIKKTILRIITDAAKGLQELHHRSPPVVHSRMRGDNILVTESEGGILGVFGLAKGSNKESGNSDVPFTTLANKTDSQRWMAPEFFTNNLRPRPPADVWGWRVVSGAPPYHRHKQASTISYKINEGPPKRRDHIKFQHYAYRPDEMWELLEQCWAQKPEDRPTMDLVVERLEDISQMPEYSLLSPQFIEKQNKPTSRLTGEQVEESSGVGGPSARPPTTNLSKDLEKMNLSLNLLQMNQDELLGKTNRMVEALQQVLGDKPMIVQDQATTSVASYVDAQQLVRTILSVTGLRLPPKLLLGRQCILDAPIPIKTGITCDIYQASFPGGDKVAKKVFRIGMSDKDYVKNYATRFLEIASLWSDFRSDYTLPFHGIGMESFEGDNHFQLYMVSPLMKNFDAMTFLKQYRGHQGMKKNILRIITDAAKGLQYLHNRNPPVVHSGMRGDNVLITDSEGAILGGFGLTRALEGGGNNKILPSLITTESQRWMAPETFVDNPPLETPRDIWSWAMAALEIVSGSVPYYMHEQAMTIMLQISKEPPRREHYPKFEEYGYRPDEMWKLWQKCWAMEPGDRPTIDEVVIRLRQIADMPETDA